MSTVWVIKDDGTRQCDDRNKGVSLEEMQKELETLGATVISSEKRQDCRIIPRVCGAPTGQVNAYEISSTDWELILTGIVGPNGFRLWNCDDDEGRATKIVAAGGEIPWPLILSHAVQNSSVRHAPAFIRELIGRPCRCYREGDPLTKDFIPKRVNIELTQKGDVIQDIWFG